MLTEMTVQNVQYEPNVDIDTISEEIDDQSNLMISPMKKINGKLGFEANRLDQSRLSDPTCIPDHLKTPKPLKKNFDIIRRQEQTAEQNPELELDMTRIQSDKKP